MIEHRRVGRALILRGHVLDVLAALPEACADCCVTSPPYFGLRDYDVKPVEWPDGWIGCLGLEPESVQYVSHLVDVFTAVARVLKPSGTLWLNLGDCYARSGGTQGGRNRAALHMEGVQRRMTSIPSGSGLKEKDLVGIPWMVAFALRDAGWYLRSDIIWAKGASRQRTLLSQVAAALAKEEIDADVADRVLAQLDPYVGSAMPESVKDRPARSHEYLFLLGHPRSGGRYYYDAKAVREPASGKPQRRRVPHAKRCKGALAPGDPPHRFVAVDVRDEPKLDTRDGKRNLRSVWAITPRASGGGSVRHFAVFPPELVEPCILAGTSERGVCSKCGTPWQRVTGRRCEACDAAVETQAKACPACGHVRDWRKGREPSRALRANEWSGPGHGISRKLNSKTGKDTTIGSSQTESLGWRAGCSCAAPTIPALVLDPFGGRGTVAAVAFKHGRRSLYIDANPEYVGMAEAYIEKEVERAKQQQ